MYQSMAIASSYLCMIRKGYTMYLFEVKFLIQGKTSRRTKGIEIEEYYDLADAWHIAVDTAIESTADDELLDSVELIGW